MYDEVDDEAEREEAEEGDLWDALTEPEECETRCYLITGRTQELNALEKTLKDGRGVLRGTAAQKQLRVEVLASWLGGVY